MKILGRTIKNEWFYLVGLAVVLGVTFAAFVELAYWFVIVLRLGDL